MLVVSLAVIGSRLGNLSEIISCLERQTLRPDKVLIYYSTEPWHLDSGFEQAPKISSVLDIEFIPVPNLGSCRKYLFTIEQYRHTDAKILLIDDDLVWSDYVVESLAFHVDSGRVATTRGWSEFEITNDNGMPRFKRGPAVEGYKILEPTEVLVPSSGWATMFRASDVDPKILDRRLHKKYHVNFSDEIFLAALTDARKYVIPMPYGFFRKLNGSSELCKQPQTFYAKALQSQLLGSERIWMKPKRAYSTTQETTIV